MTKTSTSVLSRRGFIAGGLLLASPAIAKSKATSVEVWKTPTCGCCGAWVNHLKASGFIVTAYNVDQDVLDATKDRLNVPEELRSCHTALIDGYVVEGHVPASDVELLLSLSPAIHGLAVPGMPIGSPGMEMGEQKETYATVAFSKAGPVGIFARHD